MEAVLENSTFNMSASKQNVSQCQNMPLSYSSKGDCVSVVNIRATDSVKHHLENLGFVIGATLKVVSKQWGNFIVEVKGTRIAIDKSVAAQIITA